MPSLLLLLLLLLCKAGSRSQLSLFVCFVCCQELGQSILWAVLVHWTSICLSLSSFKIKMTWPSLCLVVLRITFLVTNDFSHILITQVLRLYLWRPAFFGQRERETETETERARQRERERLAALDKDRERDRSTERDRQTDRQTETDKQRERERERERETETETETDRQTDRRNKLGYI